MSNFPGLDAGGERIVAAAADLAAGVLARHASEVDRAARFPDEGVAALAAAGLLGLSVPAPAGGQGQGPGTFVAVVEELARGCASTAMVYVMHVSATQAIAASPTLADRDHLLRAIAAGTHLTTLALSERGSRSQFWAPVSVLEAHAGGYRTSAAKSWVTTATRADSYVAGARAAAGAPGATTLYLVRKGAAGVRIAGGFDGLGLRGNDSRPVEIDGLSVATGDLVSPDAGGGPMTLEVILPWFALGTAAMANGLCRAAVADTTAHLTGQGFAHTGTALRDLPNLRARLAQMSVRTEQARALLGRAVAAVVAGDAGAGLAVLQARLSSLEAAIEVTDLAMKTCGGAAFSKHLGVERLFRDARAGWVMAPTVDHLHDFIGRALTGLPLF